MIPASHNPNVPPAEGPFKRRAKVVYTQKHNGREYPMDAEYVQPSRNRDGFSVVLVGPGRTRAIVPDCDLSPAAPSAPGRDGAPPPSAGGLRGC
ncbi:MAG: hypothetical protein V1929_00155 [bacterium]